MAEFLNTSKTSKKILELVTNSEDFICLISPYIQLNDLVKKAINSKKINVTVVFGKKKMSYDEYTHLMKCKNVSILYNEKLHAKCYISEKGAIITSMNIYEYSELNNVEMGIYIDAKDDFKLYNETYKYVKGIFHYSEVKKLSDNAKKAV